MKIAIINESKRIIKEGQGVLFFGWDPVFYGPTECDHANQTICPDNIRNLPWLDGHPEHMRKDIMPKNVIDKALFGSSDKKIPVAIWLQSMHTVYANDAWIRKFGLESI
jgi:hypothetical protein